MSDKTSKKFGIVVHGGAGTILRERMTPEKEQAYTNALKEAIQLGNALLRKESDALKAVELVVAYLEDNPLFNAGKGSVFTNEGKHEMDASIMCGKTQKAGAVAGITNVKNPIELAGKVLESEDWVMLSGRGAAEFAKSQGLEFQADYYFYTENRLEQLRNARVKDKAQLDHSEELENGSINIVETNANQDVAKEPEKFGTVGAVALDQKGNLAAATSSGGLTNKKYGRVGDGAIIGAGTYANNETCAISCTGRGEYFIRQVVAYDVSCLMEYKSYTLEEACNYVIHEKMKTIGGTGGLIAIDKEGNIALPFNTKGMYRASMVNGGDLKVQIFE